MSQYEEEVLIVYRDFPLEDIHPYAFQAAEAVDCAMEQDKFIEMRKLLFLDQQHLDVQSLKKDGVKLGLEKSRYNECLDKHKYADEVRQDISDGRKYMVTSTPTFFINGYRVEGINYEEIQKKIELVLNQR